MSALRVSVPGRLVLIDLGPGSASSGEIRGSLATPVPVCQHTTDVDAEAKRIAQAARHRAWRAANRDRLREYERNRTRQDRPCPPKPEPTPEELAEKQETRLARARRYWQANREAQMERSRRYWEANREAINARRRASRQTA